MRFAAGASAGMTGMAMRLIDDIKTARREPLG